MSGRRSMSPFSEPWQRLPEMTLDLGGCGQLQDYGLPPPVVLTLGRRPDRWAATSAQLAQRGITNPIKAPAVDGQVLNAEVFASVMKRPRDIESDPSHYLQMTRPAVGCFLSHLAIWKQFQASDEPYVLVLEDDAILSPSYTPDQGRAVMANIPEDADMVLLGCTIMDGLAEPSPDPMFNRIYYYNGTYGYLLTRRGCANLLPHLLPIETHIDNQISLALVRCRHRLRAYCVEPRCIEHDFAVRSDVYIPVADTGRADKLLDAVFKESRARLLRGGARLFDMHKP